VGTAVTGTPGDPSYAVNVVGSGSTATFSGNSITGNLNGFAMGAGTTATLSGNDLSGNTLAVAADDLASVTATCNWWGTADANAIAALAPGLANWGSSRENKLARTVLEKVAGVDRNVELPLYHGKSFVARAKAAPPAINREAPGHGRKAVIFATCFANYNNPNIGEAALKVLAKNGVEAEVAYPGCCGMPQLEAGDLARVAEKAKSTAAALKPYVDAGKDVIALVPSCALMMKFEWPLIVPDDENVKALAHATYDIDEYIADIADKEGMAPGLAKVEGGVALHVACHARAQNMGNMGAEMLRLIPETDVTVVERCSGHGGSWGIKKGNFEIATKFARQTVKRAADAKNAKAIMDIGARMENVCESCHQTFWYPPK